MWAGILFIGWGCFAIITSIIETNKSPSVGGAAQIAVMMGVVAILIGSLILFLVR